MFNKVAVLAAGSWGTALAAVLAENHGEATLWSRNRAQVDEINRLHTNRRFVGDVTLSERIHATASLEQAVAQAEALVFAVPSSGLREVSAQVRPFVRRDALLIHAAKGLEVDTLKRMSQVIADEIPRTGRHSIVALSGPSHAEEVIRRLPATVVVASEHPASAEAAQDLLINSYFRVYTNPDLVGVEIAGALKNIIALGAGMTDGLGYGDNAKAALLTRGLAEISRLGAAMGANPLTFAGLAGVGDLVVTCTSKHSRNWRAGHMLAKGMPLAQVLETMGMAVEGVRTTKAAFALSRRFEVVMPITDQLHHVLFDGKSPNTAVEDLMGRVKTREMGEIAQSTLEKWME